MRKESVKKMCTRLVAMLLLVVTMFSTSAVYAAQKGVTEKGYEASGVQEGEAKDSLKTKVFVKDDAIVMDQGVLSDPDMAKGAVTSFSNPEEAAFVSLNNFRVDAGKQPFSVFSSIQNAAYRRAGDLYGEFFGNGSSYEWYEVFDFHRIPYEYAYEFCGYGYETFGEFLMALMTSPEDASILLDETFMHIGVVQTWNQGIKFYELLLMGECTATKIAPASTSIYTGAYDVTYGHSIRDHQFYISTSCHHVNLAETMLYDGMLMGYNPNIWNTIQQVVVGYNGCSAAMPFYVKKDMTYIDVNPGDWYYNSVAYLFNKNIMAGLSDTVFGRDFAITRGQFATLLYRLSGSPAVTTQHSFTDIPANAYYEKAVGWANGVGVVSGFTPVTFGPENYITREQMAVMMYRYANHLGYDTTKRADISGFVDASEVSAYALDGISWAVAEGLISGMTPTTLAPQNTAYRVECAAIFERFMKNIMKVK